MRNLVMSLACLCLAHGCSRRAEIAEGPDGGVVLPPRPTNPLGDADLVDIAPGASPPPPCEERQADPGCAGANDFPCNFVGWAIDVARECQTLTDCRSNGVLAVDMGEDGCVSRIAMSEPNDAFATCLRERFDHGRCACGAQSTQEFLGIGNEGCEPSAPRPCAPEFPCAAGEICAGGVCTPDP